MAATGMKKMPDIYKISVIMPTYNRALVLKRCLAALAAQDMPKGSFEVIVADDGSTDNTGKVAALFAQKALIPFRYLRQANLGANAARNRAIGIAQGKVLLIINDDVIPATDMLRRHWQIHEAQPEDHLAGLGRVTIDPRVPYSPFAKVHLDAAFDKWKGQTELDWRAFYTCNVSVKKAFLLKYGLFDEKLRYHEDVELSLRLAPHGLRIIYDPLAVGYHDHFLKEEEFLGAAQRAGKAMAMWYKKAPHLKADLYPLGFYPAAPLAGRIKYFLGDVVVNPWTIPLCLSLARSLVKNNEKPALFLYQKIASALLRKAIRDEMHQN